MSEGRAAHRALVDELRERLEEDLTDHFGDNKPFNSRHVVVCPAEGYFFNGDLELQLYNRYDNTPSRGEKVSASLALQRIFHWPMGSSQTFECMDGGLVSDREIEKQLMKSFRWVTRVNSLREVVENGAGSQDCLLCVPVNTDSLDWWDKEMQRDSHELQQLLKSGVRIILAPSSEASAATSPEVFARLRDANIHCIYTANFSEAIPEAKILDAVLCSGPRVKYIGRKTEDAEIVQWWDEDVTKVERELRAAYTKLREAGALGDQFSGSASVRWSNGRGMCFITASQTDKIELGRRNVTGVIRYSPSLNEAQWVGERRPSSSTPWHCKIYHERPDVKAIIHLHNKAVTYSDESTLSSMRTEKYEPYGTIRLGAQVLERIGKGSGLSAHGAILHSHGEVAVGETLSSCVDTLLEMDRLAKSRVLTMKQGAEGGLLR
jgi:ribulose-5-phosphate 4-epimerase/fuculose-1-phosphate aldolase